MRQFVLMAVQCSSLAFCLYKSAALAMTIIQL